MFDRYKLPFVWILYFGLIVMFGKLLKNRYLNVLTIILCIVSFITYNQQGRNMIQDAKYYAKDGSETTEMLYYVAEVGKNKNDFTVLTDFSWYELNLSSSIYLQLEEGINNVYYHDDEKDDGDYNKIYNRDEKRIYEEDADVIICDDSRVDNYDSEKYEISSYFNYRVLEKK